MVSFLVIISLLLHAITIIAVITLSLRVSKAKELEMKQQKVAKEIEDLFTAYLLEVKEENKQLMNMLEKKGQNGDRYKNAPTIKKVDEVQKPIKKQPVLETELPKRTSQPNKANLQDYQPPIPTEQNDVLEQSLESKVFGLFDQGIQPEEIAKKLNCGKTEIELILKFHPRKS